MIKNYDPNLVFLEYPAEVYERALDYAEKNDETVLVHSILFPGFIKFFRNSGTFALRGIKQVATRPAPDGGMFFLLSFEKRLVN